MPAPGPTTPGQFRFRANPEPGGDPSRRLYRVTYSHEEGWSYFNVAIDLSRSTCTFHRSSDADYSRLLSHIALVFTGKLELQGSWPSGRDSLTFDFELLGLRMSREIGAEIASRAALSGTFQPDPSGDWLVVQLFVPGSTDSFVLGLNDRMAAGEISLTRPDSGAAVVAALAEVFG